MKTTFSLLAALIIALCIISEADARSNSGPARSKTNSLRQSSRQLRKRQFADNSQLINVEQNGNIFELFSTTTNLASPRGRANSPNNDGPPKGLLGGLGGLLPSKSLKKRDA